MSPTESMWTLPTSFIFVAKSYFMFVLTIDQHMQLCICMLCKINFIVRTTVCVQLGGVVISEMTFFCTRSECDTPVLAQVP